MRAKSLMLLILALGCGLVASIGITQVMAKRKAQPAVPTGETEAIFVAMQDISLGEPLTSQVLKLEPWPKDKVPKGVLTKIEDVEGRRTRTKLYSGEPILDNKLFSKGTSEQGATALIPKGYRVVGVKVDSVSGGSSMILPGDRVDVLVHLRRNPASGILNTSTRTILQDIKVFAVNDQYGLDAEDDNGKSISAKTISLLVTPAQAEKVILACQLGKIQLVMRSPEDDEHVAVLGASPAMLFGQASRSKRDAEQLAPETAENSSPPGFLDFLKKQTKRGGGNPPPAGEPVETQRDTWPMRIMQGTEVNEVMLESSTPEPGSKFWRVTDYSSGNTAAADLNANPPEPTRPGSDAETDSDDSSQEEQKDT